MGMNIFNSKLSGDEAHEESRIIPCFRIPLPSGKLVITDDLRSVFDYETERETATDINYIRGRMNWTTHFASHDVASANIGNSCPDVFRHQATGNLMIANISLPEDIFDFSNPPIDEDSEETLIHIHADGTVADDAAVSTGEHAYTVDLIDEFFTPVGWEHLGNVTTDLWAYMLTDEQHYLDNGGIVEELEGTVASITPGTYQFMPYSNHPDFDYNQDILIWADFILEN